jgi:8-oxo-dGTP pyrophosphatase MutT (NUDIX family)
MTPERIRHRFARHEVGPEGGSAPSSRKPPHGLTPAAVLVPIVVHPPGMTAVFTQRTEHLADHPGQISFPGGRVERDDADAVATALREAEEEIGLARRQVDIIGQLDAFDTSTGFTVTPVVGLVAPPLALTLDSFEVAEAFEVPLGFLLDAANHRRERRMHEGRLREYVALDYDGRIIWGATARMIVSLREVLYGL